jgi:hypothetical protein
MLVLVENRASSYPALGWRQGGAPTTVRWLVHVETMATVQWPDSGALRVASTEGGCREARYVEDSAFRSGQRRTAGGTTGGEWLAHGTSGISVTGRDQQSLLCCSTLPGVVATN